MSKQTWIGAALLALIAGSWVAAEEAPCCPPVPRFLQRLAPAGGWCPYGGPLGWWKPYCFPCGGAPDDYCRKTIPDVCYPSYTPWYIWVSPQVCSPQGGCCPPGNQPH